MPQRRTWVIFLTVLVLLTSISAAPAQQEDTRFFEETGHWVSGEFLEFYDSIPDAERLFGDPITEPLDDPLRDGISIQYFERVRLDYDPSKPAGKRVSVADLGLWLHDETQRGDPAGFSTNTPMCRQFTNRHFVCYAFLQMYDRNNGQSLFGQPVSDAEYINNRLVQYFEHVRMEWRTEMPVGQRVVLTEIGQIAFQNGIGNPELLKPVPIPDYLRQLQVQVFVSRPVAASGEQQKVYVLVRDQYLKPVPDAQVIVTLTYPDGTPDSRRADVLTNTDGVTQAAFTIDEVEPNQTIQVDVEVVLTNGPKGEGSTWFRTWW
jgi:hypothetical protein